MTKRKKPLTGSPEKDLASVLRDIIKRIEKLERTQQRSS